MNFKNPENITVVTFNEIVNYLKENSPAPYWYGKYKGLIISHENDSCYILNNKNTPSLHLRVDEVVCITEDEYLFVIQERNLNGILEGASWDEIEGTF